MNEEKILNQIKQSANSCEVPESLKPENIANKLEGIEEKPQNKRKKIYQIGGVIAAALVLVVGISAMSSGLFGNMNNSQAMSEEMDTAEEMEEAAPPAPDVVIAQNEPFSQVFKTAESYEDVQKTVEEYERAMEDRSFDGSDIQLQAKVEEAPATEVMEESVTAETAMPSMGWSDEGNFSDTNIQVEGVDEGDIVKTDGKYIYVVGARRDLRIIKIDGDTMSDVATVTIDPEGEIDDIYINEIYVSSDKVHVIASGIGNNLAEESEDVYYLNYNLVTVLYTYDLSQPEAPTLMGKVTQDGTYSSSRKVGAYFYIFTNFYPVSHGPEGGTARDGSKDMVPYVGGEKIEPASIYLPINPTTNNYTVITSVNLEQPDSFVDKKVIMEEAQDFYVTTDNIYIRKENWNENGNTTSIAKFSFKDGQISGDSAGLVSGRITDTFAINEYNGTLRVLTTEWNNVGQIENRVTVFDEGMNVIGNIEGLAPDETIYSARFFGDIGYFVTYRNVDPLFSVDFSDPHNPQILGELKITGFSEYLHPYGENRLLGIGWETDPETGERKGLKLSMFDIANPSDVREIDKSIISNVNYFYGERDYKAFTISPEKNVIGFTTSTWTDNLQDKSNYMIFSYEEGVGFTNQLTHAFSDNNEGLWQAEYTRGLYVSDTFYIVGKEEIIALDMLNGYNKVGELLVR